MAMDEEKLIVLVQARECLYNLKRRDYDNNLVKENSWKEIAEELHTKGKKQLSHYNKQQHISTILKSHCPSGIMISFFISVEDCKSKWAVLRSYYRRALNRRKTTSNQVAKKINKWCFEEQMQFLKHYFQERE
jgi:hypothetical protein